MAQSGDAENTDFLESLTSEQREKFDKYFQKKVQLEVKSQTSFENYLQTFVPNEEDRKKVQEFIEKTVGEKTKKLQEKRKLYEKNQEKQLFLKYSFTIDKCVQLLMKKIINEQFSDLPNELIEDLSDNPGMGDNEEKETEIQRKKKKLNIEDEEEFCYESGFDEQEENYSGGKRSGKNLKERNSTYGIVWPKTKGNEKYQGGDGQRGGGQGGGGKGGGRGGGGRGGGGRGSGGRGGGGQGQSKRYVPSHPPGYE